MALDLGNEHVRGDVQPRWPLGVSRAPWRLAGGDKGGPVVSAWDFNGFFPQVMRYHSCMYVFWGWAFGFRERKSILRFFIDLKA